MNNLDDLRDAMHTTPDFEPRQLDLALVMAQGGRLRRRRRIATGTASGVAVLALLVGGAQLARPEPAPGPVGGPPVATVTGPAPGASDTQSPAGGSCGAVLGDVIPTGLLEDDGERVLWLAAAPSGRDFPFCVSSGLRKTNGTLSVDIVSNETDGSGRDEGFHGASGAMEVNGRALPAFGYYVGPAAKITVRAAGKKLTAEQETWSEDSTVVVFWFPPEQVTPGTELTGLTAYDSNGRKLPAGNPTFAVG